MPRVPQGPAVKGRQKCIQKLVDQEPNLFTSFISTKLNLPDTDTITWRSLLAEDGYTEYPDEGFL
jgi:hypothetical protein